MWNMCKGDRSSHKQNENINDNSRILSRMSALFSTEVVIKIYAITVILSCLLANCLNFSSLKIVDRLEGLTVPVESATTATFRYCDNEGLFCCL